MPRKPKQHYFIDGIESKDCGKCKEMLPLADYAKNLGLPDGLRIRCKKCDNESQAVYRENNVQKLKDIHKNYCEANRETVLAKKRAYAKQFRKDNPGFDKLKSLEYQREHRGEARLRVKAWGLTPKGKESRRLQVNKRRARKKGLESNFTTQQWEDCKQYFNCKCAYCGEEGELQQDHFIPLSGGGEYTVFNVIPACQTCNFTKNRFNPFEWYPKHSTYSLKREQKILKYLNYQKNIQQLSISF